MTQSKSFIVTVHIHCKHVSHVFMLKHVFMHSFVGLLIYDCHMINCAWCVCVCCVCMCVYVCKCVYPNIVSHLTMDSLFGLLNIIVTTQLPSSYDSYHPPSVISIDG